ncbi:M16 family metallopeptidase [Rhizobium leguminosarum]|uniref:M16 family metallopeptidase n=1 Tax=Rhizobium leguminosarum TaxID=384 RepID=UPI0015D9800E|nr:pitrilysin family protein [Rhizobium leguminosarum]NZD54992.1 insulinase family protein [Rhizobium leguminosarum]
MAFHSENLQLDPPVGEKHGTSPDRVFTGRLGNGMDVIVIRDHRRPIATHMVWYRNGSADDPIGKSGIAHFLEHLMFKGTRNHPAGHFSDLLASVGGDDNDSTSWNYTNYYQRVPKDYLKTCMAYEADRMTGLIPTDEIVDIERQVVLAERGMHYDSGPRNILGEALQAGAFSPDPCGRPIIGWQHEIETLGREDALAYYHRFYTPENANLVVAGDVDPDAVMDMAETIYGAITPTGASFQRTVVRAPPVRTQRLLTLVDENVHQPAFTRIHVVPSMMATGPSSRLFTELREKRGMCYSIHTSRDATRNVSRLIGHTSTRNDRLYEALDVIRSKFAHLVSNKISAEEVEMAKSYLMGSFALQLDTSSAIANALLSTKVEGLQPDFVDERNGRIASVTRDTVADAVARLIGDGALLVSIAGNPATH